ncbi:agmatine deiminase family protein [Geomobilimonas luticola]|uniref:Agmatine deiminase family protein n=1 Tax=Geomobilimonas luticola TaxID=1114878 RepID=A0ABS5SDT8_9BACT|nr:agmatine deiminase family protein [Geomobilimonas luticola]MBT0653543.1 agmatine deiminase family protein [Geomobilimonas luticola]
MTRRFPAEWEEQDGVLLAWPHESTDWRLHLDLVEPVFTEIVRSISRFESVLLVTPDEVETERLLADAGVEMANVRLFPVETNDTWARDFGPVTVEENGQPLLLDFGFNGWGLKFPADLDNLITGRLCKLGAFRAERQIAGLIMEGGSLESDGSGTILTTAECLLSPNRNPHLSRQEIEAALKQELGAERVLWLENGYLAGDDTDSHVDTLARLCPDETIVYQSCDDPADEHYGALGTMAEELKTFRTRDGSPYRLLPLPWPEARFDDDGQRLPATYANYLVINRAVLVPTYRDKNDGAALAVVRSAFPDREVIGIDCSPLILQHGSLHCVTMQLPKGVLT